MRRVLRLRAAARRGQDDVSSRPGVAHPRARAELPHDGGDPLRDLGALGGQHGLLVVHGRRHGAAANGRGRLRRHARRQLDAERAHLRGATRRRQRSHEHSRVPTRAVRGRRATDQGSRSRDRLRTADGRRQRVPANVAVVALGHGVLDGHGHVRQRLVAGGLRRHPRPRCSRRADVRPPRVPERLPPAQARARRRRAARDRARTRVPARGVQPAGQRSLAARDRMGLDDGAGRADGGVPLGAGERAPLLQRDERATARPLGLRVGAAQHDRNTECRLRGADGRAPRPARSRHS